MNNSKVKIVVSTLKGKIQTIAGWCLIVCAICVVVAAFSDSENELMVNIICILILGIPGAWLIILGRRTKKLISEFKQYVSWLSNNTDGSIDNMAATFNKSVDEIKKELDRMIKKKFFVNAYVNQNTNCVILPNRNANQQSNSNMQNADVQKNVQYISINCPSCGGNNSIRKGEVGECEFCGSHLQG